MVAQSRRVAARERWPGALRSFRIRSYRFEWSADLFTSWAWEMETLILGWFVLATTESPLLTAAIAAMNFTGSLFSPFVGVIADRVDRRTLLIVLRAVYAMLAAIIMVLGLTGNAQIWLLFLIAAAAGLIRPSDLVVRTALITDIVPAADLPNAMGFSRSTMDMARMAGALLGAGLLSTLGIGVAYGAVTGLYLASACCGFGVTVRRTKPASTVHPWAELKSGFSYMLRNDTIVAAMCLAFLANLTAFPITHGLLPVVAKNIYGMDEFGLARLLVALACGALIGSLIIAVALRNARAGPTMVAALFVWHVLVGVFAQVTSPVIGGVVVALIGAAQSISMISMSVLLMTIAEESYRGRVAGVRMLAIYGLPMGLIIGGALIEWSSVVVTFTVYGVVGVLGLLAIIARWPAVLRA